MHALLFAATLLGAPASPAGSAALPIHDLYIARHGQTEWNRVGRWQGDPDLNPKGYEDRLGLYLALREAGIERIHTSGLFDAVVCTDSHPRARELEGEKLRVYSLAELLRTALQQRA